MREAVAETLGNPGTSPTPYDYNAAETMRGLISGAAGNAEKHGYGMAPLFTYLANYKKRMWAPWAVWSWIGGGHSIMEAIQFAGDFEDMLWYTEFLQAHVEGKLMGYNTADINRDAPADRTLDITSVSLDYPSTFKASMSDLSGKLFQTKLNKIGLPDDAVMSHRLKAPEYVDLTVYKNVQPATTTMLGEGVEANGLIKFDAPLTDCQFDGRERIVALLSNREGNAAKNYAGMAECELTIAPTWDRKYDFEPSTARNGGVYGGIPYFRVNGSIEGPGLTAVHMDTIEDFDYFGSAAGIVASAQAIGQPPLVLIATFSLATLQSSASVSNVFGGTTTYTFGGIKHYEMKYYESDDFSVPAKIVNSNDGVFLMTFDETQTLFSASVYVVYDVTTENYSSDGNLLSTGVESNCETSLGAIYLYP